MKPQLLDLTNNQPDAETAAAEYHSAMMCTRLAGHAIIRVVGRCDEAQENENLNLSECQLMQVPDAVFHLMRHTVLKTCDLSFNVITKIPAKLGTKFSCITELNVSNNRIGKLPDELIELQELRKLDISFNSFCSLPRFALCSLPKLEYINAEKNFIIDVDAARLGESSLKTLNLQQNPISQNTHDALTSVVSVRIQLTPRVKEDWEKWCDAEVK